MRKNSTTNEVGELTNLSPAEYARRLTATSGAEANPDDAFARIIATRDAMLAEIEKLTRERQERREAIRPALEAAQRAVDELERPHKELERLQQEGAIASAWGLDECGKIRQRLHDEAPACIRNAIRDLDASLLQCGRNAARAERIARAKNQVEALILRPGDPRPALEKILNELTRANLLANDS